MFVDDYGTFALLSHPVFSESGAFRIESWKDLKTSSVQRFLELKIKKHGRWIARFDILFPNEKRSNYAIVAERSQYPFSIIYPFNSSDIYKEKWVDLVKLIDYKDIPELKYLCL